MKKNKTSLTIVSVLLLSLVAGMFGCKKKEDKTAKLNVLATIFPVYQITRNVAQGREGVNVELMLPSNLGCPHDYALTPQDMQKLAEADILVVNGLGLEEFLGAPVRKANPDIKVIDSSDGIEGVMKYTEENIKPVCRVPGCTNHNHNHGEMLFEWVGAFKLEAGVYPWTFAKKNGKYADPKMKFLMLPSDENKEIEGVKEAGTAIFTGKADKLNPGGTIPNGKLVDLIFDASKDATTFSVTIKKPGIYVFFTEHMPFEFETDEHFFKTTTGVDVEPIAQIPEGDHHHHHHGGVNSHIFASPSMAAKMTMVIMKELAKLDPEGKALYQKNARAYVARLNALADKLASVGKGLKNNRIVTQHGVFDYLARDIGLDIVSVIQSHGGKDPSAAEMLGIIKKIKDKEAGGIFSEPQYSDRLAKTIANEAGIPFAELDPGATGPADAPLDYFERTVERNIKVLKKTLGEK